MLQRVMGSYGVYVEEDIALATTEILGLEKEKEAPPPPEVLERAVRKLHVAMGHCSTADLLRVMQNGGGGPRFIEAPAEDVRSEPGYDESNF